MAKYDLLKSHLARCHPGVITMTFQEIETVLDASLPSSARRSQFWVSTVRDANHAQRQAWQGAKYNAFLDADHERVRFVPHAS